MDHKIIIIVHIFLSLNDVNKQCCNLTLARLPGASNVITGKQKFQFGCPVGQVNLPEVPKFFN